MGYEITYHYHEEISKGEYDREETKTKTTRIGTPYEEIPLEVLAGKVMAQLARRSILVVDIEIFEYTKKKLNYRETPDGVVIKNKKFKFDDGPAIVVEAAEEVDDPNEQLQKLLSNPAVQAALNGNSNGKTVALTAASSPPAPVPTQRRPIRHEIFSPVDRVFLEDAKRRGLAFTVGKKYPIFSERMAPVVQAGMIYETIDDNDRLQRLSDKFFTPDIKGLGAFEEKAATTEDGLNWGGFVQDNVPDIR